MEGSLHFQEIERNGYTRTVSPGFLGRLQEVHNDFFRSPLNVNCGQCLTAAFQKLNHHMGIKRYLLQQEEERKANELKLQNETSSKKGIGKGK